MREKELKEEIEKKLNKFKKKQGIKGKQKHQQLLDSEIMYFVMCEIQERNVEVKEIVEDITSYKDALNKVYDTHHKIDWALIFLLRLRHEILQKLGLGELK